MEPSVQKLHQVVHLLLLQPLPHLKPHLRNKKAKEMIHAT
jgi:hypothetical protein